MKLPEIYEEFNISEELWKYIDNFITDYYPDYKVDLRNEVKKGSEK
jgi:hypothetical protein